MYNMLNPYLDLEINIYTIYMGICFGRELCKVAAYKTDTKKRTFAGQQRLVKVVKIYDGDTITIVTKLDKKEEEKSYRLRLSGLDAPEKKLLQSSFNRNLHIQAGQRVTDLLTKKLGGLNSVILVEFHKEEKYGRLMGTIWTIRGTCCGGWKRDININNWLLRNGLALAYDGNAKTSFTNKQLNDIIRFRLTDEL